MHKPTVGGCLSSNIDDAIACCYLDKRFLCALDPGHNPLNILMPLFILRLDKLNIKLKIQGEP